MEEEEEYVILNRFLVHCLIKRYEGVSKSFRTESIRK
jgi:hypothetical protein